MQVSHVFTTKDDVRMNELRHRLRSDSASPKPG